LSTQYLFCFSTGIENAAFETSHNTNVSSLYAEMSQQDLDDVDEGADIFGKVCFDIHVFKKFIDDCVIKLNALIMLQAFEE